MSNLNQFFGNAFPIGGTQVQMPYNGDLYTAPDGSQWINGNGTSAFSYTSAYSYLPETLTSPHSFFPGPEANGLWALGFNSGSWAMACSPTGTYVTGTYYGDSVNGYYYYTSTDGQNWTQRTFPNLKSYPMIQYTAGKFFAVSPSSTTNGVIYSTDGINWTSVTGVSIANIMDIGSDGANNIVIIPQGSNGAASSTDGGATWSSITLPSNTVSWGNLTVGNGTITWNSNAGLFLVASQTAGAYYTSPTGAVWTNRSSQATFAPYSAYLNNVKFATSTTLTVVFGFGGFFATTTDGLTWSNHGFISPSSAYGQQPSQAYYDGTRFVVRYSNRIFYSTNGTSWTEGKKIGGGTSYGSCTNGKLLLPIIVGTVLTKMLIINDVTATSPAIVIAPAAAFPSTVMTHYRIR